MRCFLYMPRKSSKSNLPAKPFPQATFAGIPSAAAVRPVSNYRQNLSHTPLLPVSRAPSPSARCRTYRQNLSHTPLLPVSRAPSSSGRCRTTGKTSPTRHFCRYPERRRRPPGVEPTGKTFPPPLSPVSRAPRKYVAADCGDQEQIWIAGCKIIAG